MKFDEQLYEAENILMHSSEEDPFTAERYRQFARRMGSMRTRVMDVGCSTGQGGAVIKAARRDITLCGVDVVESRLDRLPAAYDEYVRATTTDLPFESKSFDVVLAGEFLEHLLPHDVDITLCEFQRILRVGGRLLLTTPNPDSVVLAVRRGTVYAPGHLTQHYPKVLSLRLKMHGFANVKIIGSGKSTRYLPEWFPVKRAFGSYLVSADKV